MVEPVVIVPPGVDLSVQIHRYPIHYSTKDLLTVEVQDRLTHPEVVVRLLHVVVGPKGEAYPRP